MKFLITNSVIFSLSLLVALTNCQNGCKSTFSYRLLKKKVFNVIYTFFVNYFQHGRSSPRETQHQCIRQHRCLPTITLAIV